MLAGFTGLLFCFLPETPKWGDYNLYFNVLAPPPPPPPVYSVVFLEHPTYRASLPGNTLFFQKNRAVYPCGNTPHDSDFTEVRI
jgi:hypothetical protein